MRSEVERKMPDETLCKAPTVDLLGIQAVHVLSNLAKHLVALKESSGRLSKAAQRSYLEVIYVTQRFSIISFFQ